MKTKNQLKMFFLDSIKEAFEINAPFYRLHLLVQDISQFYCEYIGNGTLYNYTDSFDESMGICEINEENASLFEEVKKTFILDIVSNIDKTKLISFSYDIKEIESRMLLADSPLICKDFYIDFIYDDELNLLEIINVKNTNNHVYPIKYDKNKNLSLIKKSLMPENTSCSTLIEDLIKVDSDKLAIFLGCKTVLHLNEDKYYFYE